MHPSHLFDVLVPPDPSMGDYSVNLAFVVGKSEKKNPRDVAQGLCDALMAEGGTMIERCEVAGPGFVNIVLKDAWLQGQIGQPSIARQGNGEKVVIDCSAPNIAKPMHVGHLRSTIIGDSLARVYRALGYEPIRWNYIGDWGTQFGRLIAAYKKYHQSVESVDDLVKLYVRFHADMKENPALEDEGRAEFRKLEVGDEENRALWLRFRELSMAEYQKTYDLLNTQFEVVKGESEYESALEPLVQRLVATGLAVPSEGALVINLDEFSLPVALVRKSDGATLYLTRDIASLEDRIATLKPAKALYVVANEQALHFEQLFATVMKMRMENLPELVHVKFGLVLGEDGKKFSTREGNAVPLQQIIDEIIKRAADVVRAKNSALTEEEVATVARCVGIGALKYNDLRQHPYSDIVFDWDSMLDLSGNSGPYLQYTYARLSNIATKVGAVGAADRTLLVHPAERALMRHLLDFGYAIQTCARHSTLNALALYCYELAEIGNRFYEQVRINDDDNDARKSARLELIGAVTATLKEGLEILGIQTLERI
jgi:arginyl-tRNA synthetase